MGYFSKETQNKVHAVNRLTFEKRIVIKTGLKFHYDLRLGHFFLRLRMCVVVFHFIVTHRCDYLSQGKLFLVQCLCIGRDTDVNLWISQIMGSGLCFNLRCAQLKHTIHTLKIMSGIVSRIKEKRFIRRSPSFEGFPSPSIKDEYFYSPIGILSSTANKFHLGTSISHRFRCLLVSSTHRSTSQKTQTQRQLQK